MSRAGDLTNRALLERELGEVTYLLWRGPRRAKAELEMRRDALLARLDEEHRKA